MSAVNDAYEVLENSIDRNFSERRAKFAIAAAIGFGVPYDIVMDLCSACGSPRQFHYKLKNVIAAHGGVSPW